MKILAITKTIKTEKASLGCGYCALLPLLTHKHKKLKLHIIEYLATQLLLVASMAGKSEAAALHGARVDAVVVQSSRIGATAGSRWASII
jgi:hypothetical protein